MAAGFITCCKLRVVLMQPDGPWPIVVPKVVEAICIDAVGMKGRQGARAITVRIHVHVGPGSQVDATQVWIAPRMAPLLKPLQGVLL